MRNDPVCSVFYATLTLHLVEFKMQRMVAVFAHDKFSSDANAPFSLYFHEPEPEFSLSDFQEHAEP